jgi:pimeloyl-ACP methyl ester carboxylesterase
MKEHVIVLHGLALNRWWTTGLAHTLEKEGYAVHNTSYPSRTGFESIADTFLKPLIDSIPGEKVHFVVHSMGGLLVRLYAKKYGAARIGRVVMLGTPNHGSQVADALRDFGPFSWYFGSTGRDLCTDDAALHAGLGPVPFECGVIAGDCQWLHFPASLTAGIPGANDGIVSVESTKVEGMKDHITLWLDHSLMVWSPKAWAQVKAFLKSGRFEK